MSLAGIFLSGCMAGEAAVDGEIRDDDIVIARESAPQSVWLELSNVGLKRCDFVVIRTELSPAMLPTDDERITLSMSGSPEDEAYPMDAYIEIDGQPTSIEDPVGAGHQAVVEAGETVRVQLALDGAPEREERVVACNGPGDYEAGRYAVLLFDR